ncbi:MAG: hypothetical protein O2899_03940, partial [Bacteroidetes bacterium]|nr:hypothetical protein [Bacteroidota bacterium]
VIMVPESQQAYIVMDLVQEQSRARDAAEAAASQQGLQVVESGQGQAGGLPMHYVVADATTQDNQQLRIRYQFIDYAGQVFRFTGMALRTAWPTYEPMFSATMSGFRQETDPAVLNIQPDRVGLTRVNVPQPFHVFAGSQPMPRGVDALSLAILNQVEVGEQIPAGRFLKVVR